MSDHTSAVKSRFSLEAYRVKLSAFWQWWTDELLNLMPLSFRNRFRVSSKLLLVGIAGKDCKLTSRTGNSEALLTEFSLDDTPTPEEISQRNSLSNMADHVVLQLPSNYILYKSISLPAATASQLGNVLAFEMDRNTPFKAEEIYFTYRIVERDTQQQKIQVELAIVTRKILDELLQGLTEKGITVHRVVPADTGTEEIGNPDRNLLPHTSGDKRSSQEKKQLLKFWILVLLVLLIAFGSLFQRYQRAEQLVQEVEAPKALAMQVKSTREELELLKYSRNFLIDRKLTEPSTLVLLKTLTETIPDNTWLIRVTFNEGVVTLQGESTDSSALIGLIESTSEFSNARFSSPVTINPRTQKERFSITAQLQDGSEQGGEES